MTRKAKLRLMLVAFSCAVSLLALEMGVRLMVHKGADGNLYFRGTRLRPYHVPVEEVERNLQRYLTTTNSVQIYDADLGWKPRPLHEKHNAAGIWSGWKDHETNAPSGTLRVAVFGGSYSMGWEFESSWPVVTEQALNQSGRRAEVLNFGVASYSMDQALLRWRKNGRDYHPDVVVFGFNGGYCRDNMNMIRPFQHPGTEILFPKPRFVLEGGNLRLINSPAPEPERVPALLKDVQQWPLIGHEAFYHPDDYTPQWFAFSTLATLVHSKLARDPNAYMDLPEFYSPSGEGGKLAMAILRQFKTEVEATGATFWIVDLPDEFQLHQFMAGRLPYQSLLDALAAEMNVVPMCGELVSQANGKSLSAFFTGNHYTDEFEVAIGRKLASKLADSRKP